MEFSAEVAKLAEVVKKQQQRLKEHAGSAAKKTVAIVSGAVKAAIEDEKIKCKEIKSEADRVRNVLSTQLDGLSTRVQASPLKGKDSPRAGSASAAPLMEKEAQKQYAAALAVARNEKHKPEARAAAALKAARVSGEEEALVYDAMELCRSNVVATRWSEDGEEWLGFFRLPEAAVADLAAVLSTWGQRSSPIAEYAWEIVTESLDGDELENELPKWGRNQFLRLADTALA